LSDPPVESVIDRIQAEVQEIAEVLLRAKPPDTQIGEVWNEALSLHRVRYETEAVAHDDER
jgi:hypothetical protein